MSQFKSSEEAAISVSSGIEAAASAITGPGRVDKDYSSEYEGNNTAHQKIDAEVSNAQTASEIITGFVAAIRSTASEFAGMDQHIATQIENRTATLPQTSATPDSNVETSTGFEPNPDLFSEEG